MEHGCHRRECGGSILLENEEPGMRNEWRRVLTKSGNDAIMKGIGWKEILIYRADAQGLGIRD
jgi:hypothetical protein